jgi:signal transduction histidine kinase
MKERAWFMYLLGLLAAAAALLVGFEWSALTPIVISGLILACLLTAKLLCRLLQAPAWGAWILLAACATTVFITSRTVFLPLLILLVFEIALEHSELRIATYISLIVGTIIAIAIPQQLPALVIAIAVLIVAIYGEIILTQLSRTHRELEDKDRLLQSQDAKLNTQRTIITTIEQQGRAAERNRLATRIHDQVGHGMTGSILMLEAAQLQLTAEPEAARASIVKATENLRESVDKIRRDLREERVAPDQVGLAQIQATLKNFEESYPQVTTTLEVDGVLDDLSQAIWVCIYESLLETLTNLLRHSTANRFEAQISQRNRLVTVRLSDNGGVCTSGQQQARSAEESQAQGDARLPTAEAFGIIRGLGLTGIEERCTLIGGHVFFSRTIRGFCTRMTFTLKRS